ncbi:DoxX family protein [Fulvivirga sp. 29W222]|uniref:DoxX family protein n=1 Tax=Fulvivirga marina TaxID=2494733 RepID=A0A937FZP4_9BACT|nr:DoxX family protein [Fulvivirga marina]MBL6447315.1 DoxX family protein [Fulvivirga marina]
MVNKFNHWLDSIHPPIWVDFLRIAVGLFIVYKGAIFTINFESFTENIASVGWIFIAAHLGQVIVFVHLVCGIILILGAYTRLMSFLNIPILAGAVIFNYKMMLTSDNYMELPMAVIILALLILVFITGSGKFSLDERQKRVDHLKTH